MLFPSASSNSARAGLASVAAGNVSRGTDSSTKPNSGFVNVRRTHAGAVATVSGAGHAPTSTPTVTFRGSSVELMKLTTSVNVIVTALTGAVQNTRANAITRVDRCIGAFMLSSVYTGPQVVGPPPPPWTWVAARPDVRRTSAPYRAAVHGPIWGT